jgi:hypothetical protein
MGSGLGETGDQGATPSMGTGESDTNVGTDAGTGDAGEGSGDSASSGEQGGSGSTWTGQNQGEDARQPGSGTD